MIHSREGWVEPYFVTSRDGRTWERELRDRPLVARGPEGSFDEDSIDMAINAPIAVGDHLYLYYTGRRATHQQKLGAIGLAIFRRDRFAGLTNGGMFGYGAGGTIDGGELLTRPVTVAGPRLCLNLRCYYGYPDISDDWGMVRVGLCDESGSPVAGYTLDDSLPIRADEVRYPVRWKEKSDVHELVGRKLALHLKVNRAAIYGYAFAD